MTSTTRRTALGMLAAGAALTIPEAARADQTPRRVPRDLLPGGAFDRFVAARAAEDRFSGTVLLAHRGRPVLSRSYGMANRQSSVPNRPDTRFNLASVTKSLTSVAIAQLVQRGTVAFHQTLGTYLDGFRPEIANTVTVHQLLTHTAGVGLPPLGQGPPPPPESSTPAEEFDRTMEIIRRAPLRFTPGTQYGYSNHGFYVLGAIVAQVTGQSYFDYVRQHVFEPAGMRDTDFYTKPQVLAGNDIARPYWTQQSGDRVDFTTSPFFVFIGGPDGGAYSTGSDLLGFARALLAGRLVDPRFAGLIASGKLPLSQSDTPSQAQFYGYGLLDTIVNNHRVFGHSGSGPGRATNLDIYPDLDWVSVILSNYDTTVKPIVELERQLITQA